MSSARLIIDRFKSQVSSEKYTKMLDVARHRTNRVRLALECVDKPMNYAACFRSAESFGIQNVAIILNKRMSLQRARYIDRGSANWLTINKFNTLADYVQSRRTEVLLVSSFTSDAIPLTELLRRLFVVEQQSPPLPITLCFGNELDGCSKELIERANYKFVVPTVGFTQSLNISCAVAATLATCASLNVLTPDLTADEQTTLIARWIQRIVESKSPTTNLETELAKLTDL